MIEIVVAYDERGAIGAHGKLPWEGLLPADMAHFKEITAGHSVIMGRKTYLSIPEVHRPLKGRRNVVVTSMGERAIASRELDQGVYVAESIDDALEMVQCDGLVVGGASVYEQTLPYAQRAHVTLVHTEVEGADSFFPPLANNPEWEKTGERILDAEGRNRFAVSFLTYVRRH